jgi:Concanavalin A-like lectin/glucanases superfamily
LPTRQWSFLTVTYSGSKALLYVNGKLAATAKGVGPISENGGALQIGGNSPFGQHFAGIIRTVRVYNRPLTQDEIQADMWTR